MGGALTPPFTIVTIMFKVVVYAPVERGQTTGRQQPPLYSVLCGIISKRRCIKLSNCSLEKNQVPGGSMILFTYAEAENELPYCLS